MPGATLSSTPGRIVMFFALFLGDLVACLDCFIDIGTRVVIGNRDQINSAFDIL